MRIHLPLPPGPGRAMRAESEYARCGTRLHRDEAVHRAGGPGDERRAVRLGAAGVLGGGQQGLAPQPGRRCPTPGRLPQRADGAPSGPPLLG